MIICKKYQLYLAMKTPWSNFPAEQSTSTVPGTSSSVLVVWLNMDPDLRTSPEKKGAIVLTSSPQSRIINCKSLPPASWTD